MEEARRHLGGAMNAFTAMESRLEAARTQLDLAEVTHALGDRAQARAILTEAVDIFRDLDLPKRVEQAAARARRLGVEDDASPSP
jgi:hypothetical protein